MIMMMMMAAGGVLHVHDEAITSIDWVVKNVTYRPNCYMCVDSSYNVEFHFFASPPKNTGEQLGFFHEAKYTVT